MCDLLQFLLVDASDSSSIVFISMVSCCFSHCIALPIEHMLLPTICIIANSRSHVNSIFENLFGKFVRLFKERLFTFTEGYAIMCLV